MNPNTLYTALSGISEEYLSEAENMPRIRENIKSAKRKKLSITCSVAVCFVVLLSAYTVKQTGILKNYGNETASGDDSAKGKQIILPAVTEQTVKPESGLNSAEKTEVIKTNDTTKETTAVTTEKSGDGGSYGGIMIPCIPKVCGAADGFDITGLEITDSEAQKYFAERFDSLKSSLSSSGVDCGNFRIAEKGYCHVNYNGTESKKLEIRQNFRDYLAYNGDTLVAIITLVKDDDGRLWDSPAFGGPWFGAFNDFLRDNKGNELIFIYAGATEFVLGTQSMMNPQGCVDPTQHFDGFDAFQYFYNKKAVYIP